MGTLCVRSETAFATGEDSKLVLTSWCRDWGVIMLPGVTVSLPVVGAVVVGRPQQRGGLIEEKSIATGFQSQGSIGTLVECVTGVRVWVHLETLRFWTLHPCDEFPSGLCKGGGRGRGQGAGGGHRGGQSNGGGGSTWQRGLGNSGNCGNCAQDGSGLLPPPRHLPPQISPTLLSRYDGREENQDECLLHCGQ